MLYQSKTHEQFILDVKEQVGDEYEVLSTYIKSSIKILMKHNTCGHEWEIVPNTFLSHKRRCPKCNGGVSVAHDYYVNKVQEISGNDYEVLGKYINNHTHILMRHVLCGNTFETRPRVFINGSRCPHCFKNKKKTTEEFKSEVKSLVGDEYVVLDKYVNNKTKITFQHKKCGKSYQVTPKDFTKKNGNRCPYCKRSLGEECINAILQKSSIDYQWGYKDKRCKNERILEFDFIVYLENGSFCLIEFDGRLHDKTWNDTDKSKEHLQKQKENDKIKDDFCKINKIPLLRIHYSKISNIDNILKEYFKSYKPRIKNSTTIS